MQALHVGQDGYFLHFNGPRKNKFIFSPKKELSLAEQTQKMLSDQDRPIVPVHLKQFQMKEVNSLNLF